MMYFKSRSSRLALAGVAAMLVMASSHPALSRAAQAVPALAPIEAYGELPNLELVRLSPSGNRLAFVTVSDEARTLVLLDTATKEQVGGATVGVAKIRDLDWIDDDRIIVTTSKTENIPALGIFTQELFTSQIYDVPRQRLIEVLKNTRGVFPVLFSSAQLVRGADPKVLVRAYAFDNPERLDIFDINLGHGRGQLWEVMGRNVDDFILGLDGKSVARSEYDERFNAWSLHLRQGNGFRSAWRVEAPIDMPVLSGLGMNGDSVVIYADRNDSGQEVRDDTPFWDVNINTGEWRAIRFDFVPDGILYHPDSGRMIGATRWRDTGRVYSFTSHEASQLWTQIEAAFAGKRPEILSWNENFMKAIVRTSGGQDAGTYYAVDLGVGSIFKIGNEYAALQPHHISSVKAVEYLAQDGTSIRGYLTIPPGVEMAQNLPLVVMPHGGPQSHDVMGFDWWAQAMASRGYAVFQPNFRGSTGRGKAFIEAGYGEWGRKMQTDLSDGVRYLAQEGLINPEKVCIVGASYGGYAAMAGLTLDADTYRCGVSVAGLSDLRRFVDYRYNVTTGRQGGARRDNPTTRYWTRFMGAKGIDDRGLDQLSPAYLVDNIKAPLLMIHGKDDSVVPFDQSEVMASAMRRAGKPYELIELTGEDHYLSREATRQRMLVETIRFLEAHNPLD